MSDFVLEVLDGEFAGRVVPLERERLTLGRKPGNDVVVKDEKASGNHAEVVREGDAWVLRDLQSRNGTFLDGRKVTEVSLSPGDVFKVGLTGVRFRRASDAHAAVSTAGADAGAAAAAAGEGFSVHRVDQARLQKVKSGRGMLPMVAALVVLAGAGAFVWLRYGGEREPGQPRGPRVNTAVPGNLLAADAANFDADAAWDLAAGGSSFVVGAPARSGANALTVTRGEGAPFALARLREGVRVLSDDVLELTGHVRTEHGATVALRVLFSSSREDETLTLTAGTKPIAGEGFTEVAGTLTVPAGMDRARVEVLALLPGAEASAAVDDVALVKGSASKPAALSAKTGARLLMSGANAALMLAQEVLFQAVVPAPAPGSPLAALDAAARATLTDAGGALQAAVQDDVFTLTSQGVDGFGLEFAGSDGLLVQAASGAPFAAVTPEFENDVAALLLGSGDARLLLTPSNPVRARARKVASGYRVTFAGVQELKVAVGFDEERRQARERVASARAEVQGGRFAQALVPLREVVERFPHDDGALGQAQQIRAEIQQGLSSKLERLTQDLDTAKFFAARPGLARVLQDLDGLVTAYGEDNLGGGVTRRVREDASKTLADLDAQAVAQRAPGLRKLAEAMRSSGGNELAAVIEGYLSQQERQE
jgi:hypothetical protein